MYVRDSETNTAQRFGLARSEVLSSLCRLLHGKLAKEYGSYRFASPRIFALVKAQEHRAVAARVADYFLARFNPETIASASDLQTMKSDIKQEIAGVGDRDAQVVLTNMINACDAVLRTNFYVPQRYALCMRLDAAFMGVNEVSHPRTFLPSFLLLLLLLLLLHHHHHLRLLLY